MKDSDLEHWAVFFPCSLDPAQVLPGLKSGMKVLCVDGGFDFIREANLRADVFLGDGDSLESLDGLPPGVEFFNREKDFLDGEAALEFLAGRPLLQADLYGFLHGRWDMSLTHIFALSRFEKLANRLIIYTGSSRLWFRNTSFDFCGKIGQSFSIIPLESMHGVDLTGARFSLKNAILNPGFGHSLSNVFDSGKVSLNFSGKFDYLLEIHQIGKL